MEQIEVKLLQPLLHNGKRIEDGTKVSLKVDDAIRLIKRGFAEKVDGSAQPEESQTFTAEDVAKQVAAAKAEAEKEANKKIVAIQKEAEEQVKAAQAAAQTDETSEAGTDGATSQAKPNANKKNGK
ncbi:MAG: hypothetical protein OXR68_04030 [Alphaproteobacteria bacterium]|nr:hypothetical protein [Alphaproteobacteria bacterium]MDD9919775.1 hypothetical protein [Alphaproteobacteria bacterium]